MFVFGEEVGVGGVSEAVSLGESVGDLLEVVGESAVGLGEEADNGVLFGGEELLHIGGGEELARRRSRLALHVLDDAVGLARTIVVAGHLAVLEDLERRIAAHAVLAARLRLDRAVDLDEWHGRADARQRRRCLLVVWRLYGRIALKERTV